MRPCTNWPELALSENRETLQLNRLRYIHCLWLLITSPAQAALDLSVMHISSHEGEGPSNAFWVHYSKTCRRLSSACGAVINWKSYVPQHRPSYIPTSSILICFASFTHKCCQVYECWMCQECKLGLCTTYLFCLPVYRVHVWLEAWYHPFVHPYLFV